MCVIISAQNDIHSSTVTIAIAIVAQINPRARTLTISSINDLIELSSRLQLAGSFACSLSSLALERSTDLVPHNGSINNNNHNNNGKELVSKLVACVI